MAQVNVTSSAANARSTEFVGPVPTVLDLFRLIKHWKSFWNAVDKRPQRFAWYIRHKRISMAYWYCIRVKKFHLWLLEPNSTVLTYVVHLTGFELLPAALAFDMRSKVGIQFYSRKQGSGWFSNITKGYSLMPGSLLSPACSLSGRSNLVTKRTHAYL